MGFWTGKPAQIKQVSTLSKGQQPIQAQLESATQGAGAGGAYGDAADYYRDLLSNDSQTYNQMQAPEMRRFNEQIVPDLAEQFSGYGQGGSSGFRNAAVSAGTDLSERLGAMRARLRSEGAQGLQNIGAQSLSPTTQNIREEGTTGFLQNAANLVGPALTAVGGPVLGAVGGFAANATTNWLNNRQNKAPNLAQQASATIGAAQR